MNVGRKRTLTKSEFKRVVNYIEKYYKQNPSGLSWWRGPDGVEITSDMGYVEEFWEDGFKASLIRNFPKDGI